MRTLSVLIILITILTSCQLNSTFNNLESDKKDAEKVIDRFYNLLDKQEYDKTHPLFTNDFFKTTDTGKLNNLYRMLAKKTGTLQERKVKEWSTNTVKGTHPKSEYVFVYTIERSKFESEEKISLIKENDSVRIIGYYVTSDGFFDPAND